MGVQSFMQKLHRETILNSFRAADSQEKPPNKSISKTMCTRLDYAYLASFR
jgi:hypothetical protein